SRRGGRAAHVECGAARAGACARRARPDSASLARLIQAGTLVQLPDSTRWWVVRELDHSLPYVVPDVVVLLERIGTRFQDALAAMGLPPYRIEVTSVLRTPEGQAALREGNVNAAQG